MFVQNTEILFYLPYKDKFSKLVSNTLAATLNHYKQSSYKVTDQLMQPKLC